MANKRPMVTKGTLEQQAYQALERADECARDVDGYWVNAQVACARALVLAILVVGYEISGAIRDLQEGK